MKLQLSSGTIQPFLPVAKSRRMLRLLVLSEACCHAYRCRHCIPVWIESVPSRWVVDDTYTHALPHLTFFAPPCTMGLPDRLLSPEPWSKEAPTLRSLCCGRSPASAERASQWTLSLRGLDTAAAVRPTEQTHTQAPSSGTARSDAVTEALRPSSTGRWSYINCPNLADGAVSFPSVMVSKCVSAAVSLGEGWGA